MPAAPANTHFVVMDISISFPRQGQWPRRFEADWYHRSTEK